MVKEHLTEETRDEIDREHRQQLLGLIQKHINRLSEDAFERADKHRSACSETFYQLIGTTAVLLKEIERLHKRIDKIEK